MISLTVAPTDKLFALLQQAKQLAKRYREVTGRPLGITGEIAESEAARPFGLEVAPGPHRWLRRRPPLPPTVLGNSSRSSGASCTPLN